MKRPVAELNLAQNLAQQILRHHHDLKSGSQVMRKDVQAAVCDAEVHECFANAIAGTRCIRAAKELRKQSDKCVGDRMDVVRRYDAGEFGIFEQPIGQEINRSMNVDCAPDPIEGRT